MKKLFVLCIASLSFLWMYVNASWSWTPESVLWLYQQWLTKYDNLQSFSPNTYLTREQAAKFFSAFARSQWKTEDITKSCNFEDIDLADPTLKNDIIWSCKLGIFNWSKWKFMPKNTLTKAEAIAVLMRILVWKLDETPYYGMWFEPYVSSAVVRWINPWAESMWLNNNFAKEFFTRWEIAWFIYLAGEVTKDQDKSALTVKYKPEWMWLELLIPNWLETNTLKSASCTQYKISDWPVYMIVTPVKECNWINNIIDDENKLNTVVIWWPAWEYGRWGLDIDWTYELDSLWKVRTTKAYSQYWIAVDYVNDRTIYDRYYIELWLWDDAVTVSDEEYKNRLQKLDTFYTMLLMVVL